MTLSSILLLIQLASSLLTSVQANPDLPPAFRTTAISIANQAIAAGTQAIQGLQEPVASVPLASSVPDVEPVILAPTVDVNLQAYTSTLITETAAPKSVQRSSEEENPVPFFLKKSTVRSRSALRILLNVGNPDRDIPSFTCEKSGAWAGTILPRDHWEENVHIPEDQLFAGNVLVFTVICTNSDGATSGDSVKVVISD